MEPPTQMTHTMHSDRVEHESCEQRIPQPQVTDPNKLKHEAMDGPQILQAKIEQWKTDGHPKHPIWQFFSHAHTEQDQHKSSPHLQTKVHETMDVLCELCGAHVHAEHDLREGEELPLEEINLARSILHGMWDHLAKECKACTDDIRHQMKTWRQLPKETRAAPPATSFGGKASDEVDPNEEIVYGVEVTAPPGLP